MLILICANGKMAEVLRDLEAFPRPQGTLSLFVLLLSESLPKAVIFSSPFPHIHLTVYIYISLSPSFSWFNPRRRLSLPFLSQWQHFVLQWWDQWNTQTYTHTQMITDTKLKKRKLEDSNNENSTTDSDLLVNVWELVRGRVRRSVCWRSWRGHCWKVLSWEQIVKLKEIKKYHACRWGFRCEV